jgi:hypothetical protein
VKGTLQTHRNPPGAFEVAHWMGYSGLAFGLSGCGGLQRLEFTRNPLREIIV